MGKDGLLCIAHNSILSIFYEWPLSVIIINSSLIFTQEADKIVSATFRGYSIPWVVVSE